MTLRFWRIIHHQGNQLGYINFYGPQYPTITTIALHSELRRASPTISSWALRPSFWSSPSPSWASQHWQRLGRESPWTGVDAILGPFLDSREVACHPQNPTKINCAVFFFAVGLPNQWRWDSITVQSFALGALLWIHHGFRWAGITSSRCGRVQPFLELIKLLLGLVVFIIIVILIIIQRQRSWPAARSKVAINVLLFFWWLDERCGETKNGLSCQSPQNKDHTMTRYKFHLNDLVDCMCISILIQPGAHQSFIPGSNIKMSSWKSESYTRGKGYKWINLYFTVLILILQRTV